MAVLLLEEIKGPVKISPPKSLSGSPPSDANGLGPSKLLTTPTGGATTTGAAMTAPPIEDASSARKGSGCVFEELFEAGDPGAEFVLVPFFLTPTRALESLAVEFCELLVPSALLSPPLPAPLLTLARFRGVKGVRVVRGAGASLLILCTPATTEAAEIVPGTLWPTPLREGGATVPDGTLDTPTLAPVVAARAIVVGAGRFGAAETELAAAIVGKVLGEFIDVERAVIEPGGGGGTSGGGCFAGSSNVGGGNTGFVDALPVPDGPPPPVLRRGATPAAPLAALRACCTICC
mmetsp:Transcript_63507/g.125088  ORF Transcript_63507/g.125088 Transcript_63507/m.125088 type:complete len:292 (-) Transcript_63507:534-1409(-)